MRAPDWWWRDRPTAMARLLEPIGSLVGGISARRLLRPGGRADLPVVCVGNLVAGGAGKTPTAIAIAGILEARGLRPVFLSRGYGGRLSGPVQVDPLRHRPMNVGDEPLLLCRHAPAIVARDRLAGAALAASLGDVIVMDDGFQNPALAKTLSLLVVDAASGIGNGLCIPAGPVRAPLSAQLARAQALALIGEGEAGRGIAASAERAGLPVHRSRLVPDDDAAAPLRGKRVLAFAGIGRPEKFAATLRQIGCDVIELRPFADHHQFTAQEARDLLRASETSSLVLATTEKDMIRLRGASDADVRELAERSLVVPVRLVFDDEMSMTEQLSGALRH